MHRDDVIAWVESPLQLLGAAEWAHAHGRTVPVAGRLTPQIGATADELIARGARFGACEPFVGIPWTLLAQHRHWLVGDGYSGQFRLAAAVLRPSRVTFLDDGANAVAFADTLLGRRPYRRPGIAEGPLSTLVSPFALDHVLRVAARERADVFTAFPLGPDRVAGLTARGARIAEHRFEWTRATAGGGRLAAERVILGSARPVDGRMPHEEYLDWVARIVETGDAVYLPHRREPRAQLDLVARIDGVDVIDAGLPAELVLAGHARALELYTQPSSTTTTLAHVLAGTGSVIRTAPRVGTRPSHSGARA